MICFFATSLATSFASSLHQCDEVHAWQFGVYVFKYEECAIGVESARIFETDSTGNASQSVTDSSHAISLCGPAESLFRALGFDRSVRV